MRELFKSKKRKFSVIFCVLAFLICLARGSSGYRMTAHAADQTARITKQVNTYMTAIKKYDIKKIKKMLIDKECLHVTDKKMQKHIRKINRECLNYEISSVKVRGKSATVRLHITQYNIQTDFECALREILLEYSKSWSEDKVIKKLNKYLRENYHPEEASEYFEYNAKIRLTKKGNRWMINKMDKNTVLFKDASLAYFLEDYGKHPNKYLYVIN